MRLFHCLAFILLLITSCATTDLTSVWRDSSYSGHFKKVLVIGVAKDRGIRRLFEREFVHQLKSRGVEAVSSFTLIPFDKMMNKGTIISKIKGLNVDAVIITRLVGKKIRKKHNPAHYPNMYNYYSRSYQEVYRSEYVTREFFVLETNLFETETEKLVWSAISDSFIKEGKYKSIRSFIKIIIDKLSKERLF
jgi:hypothetical protein